MSEKQKEDLRGLFTAMIEGANVIDAPNAFDKQSDVNIDYATIPIQTDKVSKTLVGIETGTILDNKFIDENEQVIKGVPACTSTIVTGIPNTGKSLLFEEIALKLASKGVKVAYITSEEIWRSNNQRLDLESRMIERSRKLGLNWLAISQNLFVLDAVEHAELRQWDNFVNAYKSLIEVRNTTVSLIDSLSMLEDSRGQLKNRLLQLTRYGQKKGVTTFLISQRNIDETDGYALAGGLALSHIVDTVIAFDNKKVWTADAQLKQDTGAKQGDIINFMHILKSRVCQFKANYFKYDITKDGLVKQS